MIKKFGDMKLNKQADLSNVKYFNYNDLIVAEKSQIINGLDVQSYRSKNNELDGRYG